MSYPVQNDPNSVKKDIRPDGYLFSGRSYECDTFNYYMEGNFGSIHFKNISKHKTPLYDATENERSLTLNQLNISTLTSTNYPWLYPPRTIWDFLNASEIILGRGVGEMSIFKIGDISDDFSGYIYPGTLVQYSINSENETTIVPYSSGRGTPNYAFQYQETPEDFQPFGEFSTTPTIAPGISTGDNNAAVGIVIGENAPHTIPETNQINQSNTYFAPWPREFAFSNTALVLTQGRTVARIGAAYNIALMDYSFNGQPVQSIPLFQGETIQAGSYIYAAVKGHEITTGAFIDTESNEDNYPIGPIGQYPWNNFIDSTGGNNGWTGTPAISFSNIPDSTVAIGSGDTLPFLKQSTNGTIIVQGVTTTNTTPGLGNYYLQSRTDTEYLTNLAIRQERHELQNISGRSSLSQDVPEKAQPIGVILETIKGTGRWPFTGLPLNEISSSLFIDNLFNGDGSNNYGAGNFRVIGAGLGISVNILAVSGLITTSPELGSLEENGTISIVTDVNLDDSIDNRIYVLQDESLIYSFRPQYKGKNILLTLSDSGVVNPVPLTDGVLNNSDYSCHNMTLNNVYFNFTISSGGGFTNFLTTNSVNPGSDYYQDFTRYVDEGFTSILVIQNFVSYNDYAVFSIDSVSYSENDLTSLYPGENYFTSSISGGGDTGYFETRQADTWPPKITVSGNTIEITDFGAGNKQNDKILIITGTTSNDTLIDGTSDTNPTFNYPGNPSGFQDIVAAISPYSSSTLTVYNTEEINTAVPSTLTVTTSPGGPGAGDFPGPLVYPYTFRYNSGTETTNSIYRVINTDIFLTNYQDCFPTINNSFPGASLLGGSPYSCFQIISTGLEFGYIPYRGGTNYEENDEVETYNITQNNLFVEYDMINGVFANTNNNIYEFAFADLKIINSHYEVGDEIDILYEDRTENYHRVRIIELQIIGNRIYPILETVSAQTYGTLTGTFSFRTQKVSFTNPTVKTFTDGNGNIQKTKILSIGVGNNEDDRIVLRGGNYNAFIVYSDNRAVIDLPPFVDDIPGFIINRTEADWEKYNNAMAEATNLIDKPVLVELRQTNEQPMENIKPYGVIGSYEAPSTYPPY